jgi:hypothetical protein
MRDPTGDWERGRRENRRRSILVIGALVSAALSISAVVAILAFVAAKLWVFG